MSTRRAVTILPRALRTATATRCLTTTVTRLNKPIAEKEIPVVTYVDGSDQPAHAVIKVDQAKPVDNAATITDVTKKAFALEKDIVHKLPLTLKRFTLDGKALVEVGVKAIALFDVQQDLGDKAAAELHQSTGVPVQFYKVDIRDANAIAEVVTKVVEKFGSIDVLINSAGIAEYASLISLDEYHLPTCSSSSNFKAEEYDHAV
ncbi:MAG: hypothetical protein Q9187_006513 [Circinaria calcarea]